MVAATRVVQDGPVSDASDVGARHGDVQNDEAAFFDEYFQQSTTFVCGICAAQRAVECCRR